MPPRNSETESETETETESETGTSQTGSSSEVSSSEDSSSDANSQTESGSETGSTETETETESESGTETGTETTGSSEMYTSGTESEVDVEEKKAISKAKEGGFSEDPFQRRVPESFYEKEKKRFGDLPKNIEIGYVGKKPYFANHKDKTTSWIDPRTDKTRNHDVMKCKMGELPYGWEEEIDSEVGVYYIDHNTQSTFLDPPWDPRVQFQVSQLQKFLAEQIALFTAKLEELEAERKAEEKKKNEEIKQLEKEKKTLLIELEDLKRKQKEQDSSSSSSDDSSSDSEGEKGEDQIPKTLEEFQERLKELLKLQSIISSSEGKDELEEFKKTREEIENVQRLLKEEEETRNKILSEILTLKGQIQDTVGDMQDGEYSPITIPSLMTAEEVASAPPRKAQLPRKTRYEMEMELLMLQKKLKADKASNQVLKNFATGEQRDGALPTWVKSIDNMAASSKTLRVKIAQKQKQNPQDLSFRERMLFFTATALDNKK